MPQVILDSICKVVNNIQDKVTASRWVVNSAINCALLVINKKGILENLATHSQNILIVYLY